jgi:hypothetical protein
MNAIRQALEDFLNRSTPEQLQAELRKGNRPLLQKLEDPILVAEEPKFSLPATVSFFKGEFGITGFPEHLDAAAEPSQTCLANQDLALAA